MGRAIPALALLLTAVAAAPCLGAGAPPRLKWDPDLGVVLTTPFATVTWDWDGDRRGPLYRFGRVQSMRRGAAVGKALGARHLRVSEQVTIRGDLTLDVQRDIALRQRAGGLELVETVTMTPPLPWAEPLELDRPFAITVPGAGRQAPVATLPTVEGWAKPVPVAGSAVGARYALGTAVGGVMYTDLALPMMQLGWANGASAAVCTDPLFGTMLYAYRDPGRPGELGGRMECSYYGESVPITEPERRTFALWLADGAATAASGSSQGSAFERSMDAYFRMALPGVPPGPAWLHDVAMVDYDYLSDDGKGWDRDLAALAKELTPAERKRVALCLHGWYDGLGSYCFDQSRQRMKERWTAFGPSRKIELTRAELARRLRLARKLGFRVLLYFGDGLLQDTRGPGYRPEWDYRDTASGPIGGWQGPDTFGPTHARNPAIPAVRQWYGDYLRAMLRTYGRDVDGFVWDETFYIRAGFRFVEPVRAYADRAMMTLVAELRSIVKAASREKVFMVSDCAGAVGRDVPPYAVMADGTYQDSACRPEAWSYGLFPNWRNVLWSCNWNPITNFQWTRWGVDTFGAPVAISNGWGDDRGPSEWRPSERAGILQLFRARLNRPAGPRYLTLSPARLLETGPSGRAPADPIPPETAGWTNWALAANGSRASASSEDDYGGGQWGPNGLIDGRRDPAGWGSGHGWASKHGEPLPQWAQVDFHSYRTVRRIVVANCDDPKAQEPATKWGVLEFDIEARTPEGSWGTVVHEGRGKAMAAFVYELATPVRTDALRIRVTRVAPLDGQARLLQLEAWGPGS